MANSVFIGPFGFINNGTQIVFPLPGAFPDGTSTAPSITFATFPSSGLYNAGSGVFAMSTLGVPKMYWGTTVLQLPANIGIQWSATDNQIGIAGDVSLFRDAVNTLALRNGTNAQAFRMYETYTDASNYSRLGIQATGTTFDIYGQQAGTGVARAFRFGTNNSPQWQVSTSGHLLTVTNNTYDIGDLAAAGRPATIYAATRVTAPAYTVGSTAGASFGPGPVTSLTVVNGIVTAAS